MFTHLLTLRNTVITLCLLPFLSILLDIFTNNLGANAIQALHIRLGDWSLRFLWLTLTVTPIQVFTNWRGMAQYRQLIGLFAFFYASVHLLVYLLLDQALQWHNISLDILESSYIWFGIFAYCILFLLALSSPKKAKKILGKSWKKLHRWIYYAAVAVIIHYYSQLKGNLTEPFVYSVILGLLLLFRLGFWYKNKQLGRLMIPRGKK